MVIWLQNVITIAKITIQSKFKPAKIFKGAVDNAPQLQGPYASKTQMSGPRNITGISFDDRGDQVVTAADDETFRLYNCKTGKQVFTHLMHISVK